MKKARLYSTVWAILGGLIFAYILVQVQYSDTFLLGDVMRLALPDNFVGVYYRVDTGSLEVSSTPLAVGNDVVVDLSYDTESVSVDVWNIVSQQEILSVIEDDGFVSISLRVVISQDAPLFSLPLISDEEYHIVVSDASVWLWWTMESLAIQRL